MEERVSETATILHKLRKSLKLQDSQNTRFEKFDRQRRLVVIVIDYIMRLYSMDDLPVDHVFGDLLKYVTQSPDLFEVTSDLFKDIVCVLEGFFSFPKVQMSKIAPTPSPNEAVAVFIDFLLQISEEILHTESDFIVSVKGSIEILRTELAFLITFLGDTPMHLQPTEVEETHNVLTDMEAVVNEVGSFLYSFFFTQDAQVLVTRNLDVALSDLLPKFELLKIKIKNHCITFLKIPSCVTPNTAVFSLFIVDSLIDDLKDLMDHKADMIVGVSNQIRAVHEELIFLRSSLTDREFQDHPELEELVIPTSDIAYEVEYIINSFPPVWYLSIRLPQVLEKIKLIRMALEKIRKNQYTGIQKVAEYPNGQVSLQAEKPPILDDMVVGFEDHIMEITEKLVRGPEYLQIISIFGMPGVGKTSLARKLYNDPSVTYRFHKRAWCVVSHAHRMRDMLIDILRSISNLHRDEILKIEDAKLDEYLVGNVYKGLKGRRYLIIMDDIWDINAWDDLEMYFPDDRNGSRILFTTRHRQVGLKASGRSVIHELTLLSENQCWDILQRKVFHNEHCPPQLVDVGKQIAIKCDGLPLAVVVIAAVLAKMEKKISLWQNVAGSLSSHISRDPNMCMNILELSYKNLPIHLKPCFLYFGVFQEDKEIPVQKLIELWVAEGFIKREEEKSSEDVAYKYLMDLIDRSLVLVTKRRYDGGVKACAVHDLLRDLCLRIGEEENFQKVIGK
ncbi:putative late blight resistance protein-like protein R1A-6 [Forsythia ovata]|uniref:Late blight resistance protein-like protein R1A-6 n=1 Tax=Forsythia ovata TaxID=205694 RepID=A0ABD1WSW1_9LAMI